MELTVNLPKLEPFTRDHHASWVFDSGENSPTPELQDTSLPRKINCVHSTCMYTCTLTKETFQYTFVIQVLDIQSI